MVDDARVPLRAAVEPTEELARFLGHGQTLQLSRWSDLDDDGDEDAIVIASAASSVAQRTLLILRRRADGALERVVDNPRAVPSQASGGMLGDPLRDLVARRNGFTLHLEGGSRELWSQSYEFRYSKVVGTWLLERVTETVLDRNAGASNEIRKGARDFGVVKVDQFAADEIP